MDLVPVKDGKSYRLRFGKEIIFEEVPLEVERRLEIANRYIDESDVRDLLDGTVCTFQGKDHRVDDVLLQLSRKLECPVGFYGSDIKQGRRKMQPKQGMFWDVIRSIPMDEGNHLVPYVSHSGAVDMHVREKSQVLTASQGILFASLDTEKGRLNVLAEPKADMITHRFDSAVLFTPGELPEDYSDRIRGDCIALPEKFKDPMSGMQLQITIEFSCHRVRKFKVNVDTPQDIITRTQRFRFEGVTGMPDELGAYHATLLLPDGPRLFQRVRCDGRDDKDGYLPAVTSSHGLEKVQWGFGKTNRPASVIFSIPDLYLPYNSSKQFTATFIFKHQ